MAKYSPPRRGGEARGQSRSREETFFRADGREARARSRFAPVCAGSVASRDFLGGAASPPLRGGEYARPKTSAAFLCLFVIFLVPFVVFS